MCIQNIKLNLEATAREIATAQSQLLKTIYGRIIQPRASVTGILSARDNFFFHIIEMKVSL